MQLMIGGVPAAVSKVLKNLSVSVHYLNEYLKKSWGLALEEGLTTSDTCSEYQPNRVDNMESGNGVDEHFTTAAANSLSYENEDRGGAAIQEVRDLHPAPDCKITYLAYKTQ